MSKPRSVEGPTRDQPGRRRARQTARSNSPAEEQRLVAERAASDRSNDWVERVSDAVVRAGEIVGAAQTSHDTAERLISTRTPKTGRKGRKSEAAGRPRPLADQTPEERDDAPEHAGSAEPI
jgi:hypothetical protein